MTTKIKWSEISLFAIISSFFMFGIWYVVFMLFVATLFENIVIWVIIVYVCTIIKVTYDNKN